MTAGEGASAPNPNCDGAGPHDQGEVRVYPLGGGANLILCYLCWVRENKYRYERATVDSTGLRFPDALVRHDLWPQQNWAFAEVHSA